MTNCFPSFGEPKKFKGKKGNCFMRKRKKIKCKILQFLCLVVRLSLMSISKGEGSHLARKELHYFICSTFILLKVNTCSKRRLASATFITLLNVRLSLFLSSFILHKRGLVCTYCNTELNCADLK